MAHDVPPLTPFSLDVLLGRVAHEFASRNRIFDSANSPVLEDGPRCRSEF